jgi:hypothetical protein
MLLLALTVAPTTLHHPITTPTMPRPKLPPAEKRSAHIFTALLPIERTALARLQGQGTLSDALRDALLRDRKFREALAEVQRSRNPRQR